MMLLFWECERQFLSIDIFKFRDDGNDDDNDNDEDDDDDALKVVRIYILYTFISSDTDTQNSIVDYHRISLIILYLFFFELLVQNA